MFLCPRYACSALVSWSPKSPLRAGIEAKFGFKPHPHMLRHVCGYALANRLRGTLPPLEGANNGSIPVFSVSKINGL